jgi:LuxR family maltose regulon positive regulatory protein
LERSNLFLVALDDRRRWYRYHHLFGDVLRARLGDERPDAVAELHRGPATGSRRRRSREAVHHALAAADHPSRRRADRAHHPALRQARQEATLRAWLDALPTEVFADRPVLALGLVGARMGPVTARGARSSSTRSKRSWPRIAPTGDAPVVHDHVELRRLPAQAAMYRAALALLRGDLAGTIAHAGGRPA